MLPRDLSGATVGVPEVSFLGSIDPMTVSTSVRKGRDYDRRVSDGPAPAIAVAKRARPAGLRDSRAEAIDGRQRPVRDFSETDDHLRLQNLDLFAERLSRASAHHAGKAPSLHPALHCVDEVGVAPLELGENSLDLPAELPEDPIQANFVPIVSVVPEVAATWRIPTDEEDVDGDRRRRV